MAKVFRSWNVNQGWLPPSSLHEFVPPDHLVHFVRDTVREALDLSAILDTYTEERGFPPYHPGMMVALLLSGYSRSIYSSRQLARACEERVDVLTSAPSRISAGATLRLWLICSCRCCNCVGPQDWCSSGMWPWTAPS